MTDETPHHDPLARSIDRLRALRIRPDRNVSIDTIMEAKARDARRTRDQLGSFIELWNELVPADLASHTAVTGTRAGTVTVAVDSAAVRFAVDQMLRSGLLMDLRAGHKGTLTQVRLRIDPAAVGEPHRDRDDAGDGMDDGRRRRRGAY